MSVSFIPVADFLPYDKKPFLIAGPCSAETEQQVMATALALKPYNPQLFRAGIWKPRTRPGAFEGVGETALKWLQNVQREVGLKAIVEVATAKHIELCLKHEIHALWIGARSTVNPFTVQEIADALKGVDIPIVIKNPVNPDLNLWVGAIERIYNAGIKKIIAVHRGFSSYDQSKYRNEPTWEIPIELKRIFPHLFLLCDPSHITGNSQKIAAVAQKALDLNFDGLMIETHIDPNKAWSDKAQQITPEELGKLLLQLIIRQTVTTDILFNLQLENLRTVIDSFDKDLIQILMKRMRVSAEIGQLKSENNITILQAERWAEIFHTRKEIAQQINVNPELVYEIFKLIHRESIKIQNEVMKSAPIK